MGPNPTKWLLAGLAVFAIGFGSGAVVIAAIAAKASRSYAIAARLTGKGEPSLWRSVGEKTVDVWSKVNAR